MSNFTDPQVTIVGNLTGDPELRFTPSGAAVANFTVAHTPRRKNPKTDEWEDGDAAFYSCSVWREVAENVAESLTKGTRVIVAGTLKQREYEHKDGGTRRVTEIDVSAVGPELRWATAAVTRTSSKAGHAQASKATRKAPSDDPWGGGGQSTDPWGAPQDEQPPF